MKKHHYTLALASLGVISLGSVTYAEEQAMSQVLTAVSSTTLSGYVDTAAAWKMGGMNGGELPGRFNDNAAKMQGFNLNVVGLTVEKPLSEEELWAAGYRVDLLFGPDAVNYNPVSSAQNAELAIKQAYVDLLVPMGNGLDVKAGAFNTIIGYESFESYANPNWGRSYGWQIEPTQHTGVLASYQFTEAVSASAGIANTWFASVDTRSDRGDDFGEGYLAWMASLGVTAPDSWGALSGSSWSMGIVSGDSGEANTTSFYTGVNMLTGLEGLSVGAAFDYRWNGPSIEDDSAGNPFTLSDNYAYAIAGYLSFAATEKMTVNARLDYTKGSDGTFYDAGAVNNSDPNSLFGLTGTLDYQLWANVLSRLELRWDTAATSDEPFANGSKNAITLAANFIYLF
jgi:hypothetical protein